jgi:hypothetical protein
MLSWPPSMPQHRTMRTTSCEVTLLSGHPTSMSAYSDTQHNLGSMEGKDSLVAEGMVKTVWEPCRC